MFTLDGNAEAFKRGGWVGAEKRHTWMQDGKSELTITTEGLDKLPPETRLELVIDGKPLLAPGKIEAQRLTIQVNGEEMLTASVREPGLIRCPIPLKIAQAETPLRITFLHPDAARPCDLSADSNDVKLLSFAAHTMTLQVAR